jgi:hypothetical protein
MCYKLKSLFSLLLFSIAFADEPKTPKQPVRDDFTYPKQTLGIGIRTGITIVPPAGYFPEPWDYGFFWARESKTVTSYLSFLKDPLIGLNYYSQSYVTSDQISVYQSFGPIIEASLLIAGQNFITRTDLSLVRRELFSLNNDTYTTIGWGIHLGTSLGYSYALGEHVTLEPLVRLQLGSSNKVQIGFYAQGYF